MVVCIIPYGIATKMDGMNPEYGSEFYKWLKANFIYSCHKKYHPIFEQLFENMHENTREGFYNQFQRWKNNSLGIHAFPQYLHVKNLMDKL